MWRTFSPNPLCILFTERSPPRSRNALDQSTGTARRILPVQRYTLVWLVSLAVYLSQYANELLTYHMLRRCLLPQFSSFCRSGSHHPRIPCKITLSLSTTTLRHNLFFTPRSLHPSLWIKSCFLGYLHRTSGARSPLSASSLCYAESNHVGTRCGPPTLRQAHRHFSCRRAFGRDHRRPPARYRI